MSDARLTFQDLLGNSASTNTSVDNLDNVAIVGAGIIGRGIAWSVALSGTDVLIIEKDEQSLELAQQRLGEAMDREILRWAMTSSEKKSILSRINWSTNLEEVSKADLVIEAITEDFNAKCELVKILDQYSNPNTIIISNTSTFSLSKIAEVTNKSDKIIGMHFQHPVQKVPLVELVRGMNTSDETVAKMKTFASKIGKTAVEIYEYPGFVTTRCIVPLLNEAMHLLMEGISSAIDIDTAMKLAYNLPSGPLEMADTMGLDELLTVTDSLWQTLGEPRFRACPILRKYVREKKLGKKSGEGFFKYNAEGKIML